MFTQEEKDSLYEMLTALAKEIIESEHVSIEIRREPEEIRSGDPDWRIEWSTLIRYRPGPTKELHIQWRPQDYGVSPDDGKS